MVTTLDHLNLQRFVAAQQSVYATALAEIKAGSKKSHWMWFIFPQAAGLGSSAMARSYAIHSIEEGVAYLAHPILGSRLIECTSAMLSASGSARDILGSPDDVKFRSSMTLFEAVGGGPLYREALHRFFKGENDPATIHILSGWQGIDQ